MLRAWRQILEQLKQPTNIQKGVVQLHTEGYLQFKNAKTKRKFILCAVVFLVFDRSGSANATEDWKGFVEEEL